MQSPKIKYVKRARSWCVTSWEKGKDKDKQIQKWFAEKPVEKLGI